jgi:diaminopimelate epimerase
MTHDALPAPALPFFKMNGIGNAILVVDARAAGRPLAPEAVRRIAERERFDQLMAIRGPEHVGTDAFVDIFNHDGSRAGACGNGTRCVAWVLFRERTGPELVVETDGGPLACRRLGATRFAVDMGTPGLGWSDIPLSTAVTDTRAVTLPNADDLPSVFRRFSAVSMGNPHAVFFVPAVEAIDLAAVGPVLEHHAIFPERANISVAQILDRTRIRLRVWERSAGATLACGSAACATLVAAVRAGVAERDATVSLPGGDLSIQWREIDDHVIMTGDTEVERQGLLPIPLLGLPA